MGRDEETVSFSPCVIQRAPTRHRASSAGKRKSAGNHVKNPQDGTIKDPSAKLRKPSRAGSNQIVFVSQRHGVGETVFTGQHAFRTDNSTRDRSLQGLSGGHDAATDLPHLNQHDRIAAQPRRWNCDQSASRFTGWTELAGERRRPPSKMPFPLACVDLRVVRCPGTNHPTDTTNSFPFSSPDTWIRRCWEIPVSTPTLEPTGGQSLGREANQPSGPSKAESQNRRGATQ